MFYFYFCISWLYLKFKSACHRWLRLGAWLAAKSAKTAASFDVFRACCLCQRAKIKSKVERSLFWLLLGLSIDKQSIEKCCKLPTKRQSAREREMKIAPYYVITLGEEEVTAHICVSGKLMIRIFANTHAII